MSREVPSVITAPVHGGGEKPCVTMTECAIHTMEVEGKHYAAIVHSRPDLRTGSIAILDRAEVEAHITLLRNAIEDAERLDAGLGTIHAAESLRRN
jgi:hypothetical protein